MLLPRIPWSAAAGFSVVRSCLGLRSAALPRRSFCTGRALAKEDDGDGNSNADAPVETSTPPSPQIDVPSISPAPGLTYPRPNTTNHHDLASFLSYAERSSLDQSSKVFVGTHFEYTVAATLAAYGFDLRRVGGSSDYGIDLLGTWSVPSSPSSAGSPIHQQPPFKVLLQCKVTQQPRPHLIRELEGAFIGAPAGWRGSKVLGFLVTERPATKGIRNSLGRSRWPMGFISCSRLGHVHQILWNMRAESEGLEGIGVGMRYCPPHEDDTEGKEGQELVLTRKGEHLPYVKRDT